MSINKKPKWQPTPNLNQKKSKWEIKGNGIFIGDVNSVDWFSSNIFYKKDQTAF
jgi:hypothetical protein